MNRQDINKFIDHTFCFSNGNIYHEYLLLGALLGLKISKDAVNRTGRVLYIRNGMLLSGADWLCRKEGSGFKYLDLPSKDKLNNMIMSLTQCKP